jgi:hypothetical protein
VDGRLQLDSANLCSHIASTALVFDDDVDTLHNDAVIVRIPAHLLETAVDIVAVDYALHRTLHPSPLTTGSSGIPTRHNLNCVTLLDSFHATLHRSQ